MIRYNVRKGPPIHLHLQEEIALTMIIRDTVHEYGDVIWRYNICVDHVHILIYCPLDELPRRIGRLKSISSKLFHREVDITSHCVVQHKNHLWSAKFYYGRLVQDRFYISYDLQRPSHLSNTFRYIRRNRLKHGLVESAELERIILDMETEVDLENGID